jgi:hypothetical protein
MRIVLLEIHDDPVPDYIIMDVHGAIKVIATGYLTENVLVPRHDVTGVFTEGNMDHMLSLEELVGGDMDKAGGFSDAFTGSDDPKVSFAHAAMDRFFKDPQRAFAYQFFFNHR